jgi:hypothetical protein
MLGKALVTALLSAQMGAYAQALDLRGRVVQANGVPVADALVELKTLGKSAHTAADGKFALNDNTALRPESRTDFDYRLDPEFLWIETRTELPVRMEVFDLSGQTLGGFSRRLPAGSIRIALTEAMTAPSRAIGLYMLRLRLGSQTLTRRIFYSRTRAFPPSEPGPPAKGRRARIRYASASPASRISPWKSPPMPPGTWAI